MDVCPGAPLSCFPDGLAATGGLTAAEVGPADEGGTGCDLTATFGVEKCRPSSSPSITAQTKTAILSAQVTASNPLWAECSGKVTSGTAFCVIEFCGIELSGIEFSGFSGMIG